jgi:hypothetical protein
MSSSRQIRRAQERARAKQEKRRLRHQADQQQPATESPNLKSPSDAQVAANQANAQHSTGPRTEEGKARSSQNRRSHGFNGSFVFIPGEDVEQYFGMLADLMGEFQPKTPTEDALVVKMAQSHWLVQRALRMMDFNLSDPESNMALMMRYQTTYERAYYRALHELTALQRARSEAATMKDQLVEARLEEVQLKNTARRQKLVAAFTASAAAGASSIPDVTATDEPVRQNPEPSPGDDQWHSAA